MKAAALLGSAVFLAGVAVDVDAKPSSAPEFRGYETCVGAADADLSGLVTARGYYINRTPTENQYFINGTAWEQGERVQVRVACDTTRNGRTLLEFDVAQGTYVLDRGQVNVRVAQN
jgi:hypothetical protein